jgi:hypothetical protein
MAFEGAQAGDAPAEREGTAKSRPEQDSTAAAPGLSPRQERRSQSFAYQTKAFPGNDLAYAILTQPSQGWVTNNGDGTFSFDPGLDFRDLKVGETRRISFSYQVSDGWSGAETEFATLAITGDPDGTLAIEAAAGNTARRSAPPQINSAADRAPSGAIPPQPPKAQRPEASGKVEARLGADEPIDAPAVTGSSAVSTPPEKAPDIAPLEPGMSGAESPDTRALKVDPTATFPARASLEAGPQKAVETPGLEPAFETPDPLAYGAGAGPYMDDGLPPDTEEAPCEPDLSVGPRDKPADAETGPQVSAEFPLRSEDDTPYLAPSAAGLEASPVEPGLTSDGEGRRYTILAQPSQGRVEARDDGGFDFTPGADFPDLAVGELEQVSFTCEAADADGAKRIVIASLTVSGTSDGPEVCDVSYRQAQGKDAIQRPTSRPDNAHSDTAWHGAQTAPVAAADPWPEPTRADLVRDGEIARGMAQADAIAKTSDGALPAAAGLDGEEPVGPPGSQLAAETPGAAPASPSWQPDREISAAPLSQEPVFRPQPSTDAIATSQAMGAFAASGPDRSQQDDTLAWEPADKMPPEPPSQPAWQANPDDLPSAFEQSSSPGFEPPVDNPTIAYGGEIPGGSESYGNRQVEPAAWEPAGATPAEAAAPPMWHREGGAESASGLAPDLEPAAEILAADFTPTPSDQTPAMFALDDATRNDRAATATTGDDDLTKDDYRAAVAGEAVTTVLPDGSNAQAARARETVPGAKAVAKDLAPGPATAEQTTSADFAPHQQDGDLDDLLRAFDQDEPPRGAGPSPSDDRRPPRNDDRDANEGGFRALGELPSDALSDTGAKAEADDGEALQVSDAIAEIIDAPSATGDDVAEDLGLALVDPAGSAERSAELSDFVLSQDTVCEKSEIGTVVGQVLVTGAQEGSRFIFDLQNDAGGRFDINPRTGKITVAEGALLDHLAADSHEILVQIIAHSGVSCRKTLTIKVLPASADQAVGPPAVPTAVTEPAAAVGDDVADTHALPSKAYDAETLVDGETHLPDNRLTGGRMVDTLHLDGVTGGPGLGGWVLELSEGEIVETNDDNLVLSEKSTGIVILEGCPVKVAFQGVERIEW